jgi:hypothetical protein
MRQLHGTTLQLLITMYDPLQFQDVMERIVLEMLEHAEDNRYPFMTLQFGDDPVGEVYYDGPPRTYIWN